MRAVAATVDARRARLSPDSRRHPLRPASAGRKLKLDRLRDDYTASVSTLREVLSRLSSEKLVVAEGQRGFEVAPVSAKNLKEIAALRQLLEGNALAQIGQEFIKMARDQLGIQIITPVYFGSRHVNLKPDKTIKTPADLAGIKLRMPPGEFWQFLGESIGANPTPVAYAEVYTALQTGTIDGQDNPLVASKLMKFDEVTSQFVLTAPRHRLRRDGRSRTKVWDAMTPAQQAKFQAAAEKAIDDYTAKFNAQEKEVARVLQGRKARRSTRRTSTPSARFAQKKYVDEVRQRLAEGRARAHQRASSS